MCVIRYAPIQSGSMWNNSELTLRRSINVVVKRCQFYLPINIQITNQSMYETQMQMNQIIQQQKIMGKLGAVSEHLQGSSWWFAEVDSDQSWSFGEVLVFN